jgi:NAD(P)-dependent dehydrogenase (short-subunit alcohol dehydrogenase family)
VTDRAQVQAVAESDVVREGLQVLALHHGIDGSGALRDLDASRIRRIMAINGTAVATLIEAFLEPLRRGAPSAVVAVSSQAGIKAEPFNAAYCAAKFGVTGLVQGLARVLAPDGIHMHVLCPGCTDTPLLRAAFEGFARGSGKSPDFYRQERTAKIPMQRLGSPTEMGEATVYLAQLQNATGLVLAPTGAETLT